MKISLLEKREDFDQILKTSLEKNSFRKSNKNRLKIKFYVNKHLNFIASTYLPKSIFQTLINEYSTSLTWWRKGIQIIYVNLATSKLLRVFFSHRSIYLPENFKDFLIIGGNHRIRLFYKSLIDSIVLLKNGENIKFISNDIELRTNNNLSYAPAIFEFGNDWFREEYFNGVPLNRLGDFNKILKLKKEILSVHSTQLIQPNLQKIKLEKYIEVTKKEINSLINNKNIDFVENITGLVSDVFDLLFNNLELGSLNLSWTHGDFQPANILIQNNEFKVIDWEASNMRYYLYDHFTLLSQIRSGIKLKTAVNKFKVEYELLNTDHEVTYEETLLLLIEELRFNLNEEFSQNSILAGLKTQKLCNSIKELIND